MIGPEIQSRALVIFGALGLIKLGLLVSLRKHLQETHWRVNLDSLSTLGMFSFYAVGILLVFCLFLFGKRCHSAGVKGVRIANAIVLGLGGMLIFLSFHEGDKNYLYPVMSGALKWWHLWSYLSLNLFFRPPYLAAWMFVYAACYYVLCRTGRERQVLTLTAVFAGLYWVSCLREFMIRQADLWVTLVFGLLSLFLLQFPKRPFHARWLLLPVVWTMLMWSLFRLEERDLSQLQPYFVMLIGCLTTLFIAATLLAKREGFWDPWLNLLPFLFVAILLLSSTHYPIAENYNNLLGFAAKVPSYFFGELMVVATLMFVAVLWRRFQPRGGLRWLDVLSIGLIGWAIVDLRLTQIMGVRLGWDVLVFANDPKIMLRMSAPYLPLVVATLTLVCAGYVLLVNFFGKRLESQSLKPNRQSGGGWYLVGCLGGFALLGMATGKPDNAQRQCVLHMLQTTPVWRHVMNSTVPPQKFFQASQRLGVVDWIGERSMISRRQARDLNVLLIFQESTFNKHLSLFGGDQETQPQLSRFRDRMEVFPNFFSSFASSIHARFATFTGLYPVRDFGSFTRERVPVQSIFEVLAQNGYECSLFYSSYLDYTGFRSFLQGRDLTEVYDADTMPGAEASERVLWGIEEKATTRAIRERIRKYATDEKRFFLTYVPAAPHNPFDKIPREFCKFAADKYRDFTPLYLNALLYMDWNIASIVDELEKAKLLDKTLVIITSDHGEMLGEGGGPVGHGWRIAPSLANVPLIIMDPDRKGYQINQREGSQVDLLPTLLDSIGISTPVGELYQGRSLYAPSTPGDRKLYLSSYEDFAIVSGREICIGSRNSEGAGGDNMSARVYTMANLGAKTVFAETNAPSPQFSIRQFDEFQEALLRDYAKYRDWLLLHRSPQVVRSSR